jgi:hypothetical protein
VSALIGGALPQPRILADDRRATDAWFSLADWRWILPTGSVVQIEPASWVTPWWPRPSFGVGDPIGTGVLGPGDWYSPPWTVTGANGRLGFAGITRDAYGVPIAGATVRLFRTSDSSLQSQVTSDGNGAYTATTPFADAHFLVVHQGSAPEIAGASISTLLPG